MGEAVGDGVGFLVGVVAADVDERQLALGEDHRVDDQVLRVGLADAGEELVVAERVVEKTEAEDDVDVQVLVDQDVVDVTAAELVAVLTDAVVTEVLVGVVDEVLLALDADDVAGPGLQCGQRPATVVAGDVEDALAGEDVAVLLKDRVVTGVQAVAVGRRDAGLEEARVVVEERFDLPRPWFRARLGSVSDERLVRQRLRRLVLFPGAKQGWAPYRAPRRTRVFAGRQPAVNRSPARTSTASRLAGGASGQVQCGL